MKKSRRKRKMWIVIIVILVVIGISCLTVIIWDTDRKDLLNMKIEDIDFSKLKDGKYKGEFKGKKSSLRNAKVEVIVSNGKVVEINLLEGYKDKSGKLIDIKKGLTAKDLYNDVIKKQTLKVDTISGATVSSNALLKAVEDALD